MEYSKAACIQTLGPLNAVWILVTVKKWFCTVSLVYVIIFFLRTVETDDRETVYIATIYLITSTDLLFIHLVDEEKDYRILGRI